MDIVITELRVGKKQGFNDIGINENRKIQIGFPRNQ